MLEATITYMNRDAKFQLRPSMQDIDNFMQEEDVTSILLKKDDKLVTVFQRIIGDSWMLTDVVNQDVHVGDRIDVTNYYMDEGVWTHEFRTEPKYYNPAQDDGAYELFITLSTTNDTLRVASGNYLFLVKVAIGYLLTEDNLYNIQVNLWGEFVEKYQRIGGMGKWEATFGYGESMMFASDEMVLGYLKGKTVVPVAKEFNQ